MWGKKVFFRNPGRTRHESEKGKRRKENIINSKTTISGGSYTNPKRQFPLPGQILRFWHLILMINIPARAGRAPKQLIDNKIGNGAGTRHFYYGSFW